MDIARREVDIGVRNGRPDRPWLAGRRTATVDYAVCGRDGAVTGFIGASHDAAQTPSAAWVRRHHGEAITTSVNDPHLALALAQAGAGRVVLPCFIARSAPGLMRLSEPIAELQSEEGLVSHHEARHDPAIRAALDAIGGHLAAPRRAP
jgi:DNA-binding transcriptional LysR family regulator